MEMFQNMMIILLTGILTENFVLKQFLGICPFLGVSQKASSSLGMGIAVTIVMILSSMATYPIHHYLLVPFGLEYLTTIPFILIIALFVQLIEMFLKRFIPPLYKALGIYLPLIATNCAVLGVTILNINNEYTFIESIFNSLGAGTGFLIALLMFSGVRKKLQFCNVPKTFEGTPITLIAASIVSMSFSGFTGIVEGIFGGGA